MSQEEQECMIGKLHIERASRRRQISLLKESISSMANMCASIDVSVRAEKPILDAVFAKVDEIERVGGLKKMQEWIGELKHHQQRIGVIDGIMWENGAE